jgi:hypothetical protein
MAGKTMINLQVTYTYMNTNEDRYGHLEEGR